MSKRVYLFFIAICVALTSLAQQPKYIFVFIGDGMGISPVQAAEAYNREVLADGTSLTMLQFPVASMCQTYSASAPITDSAAAGTAIATGSKTRNGMLGMDADTVAVASIAAQLHERGYGVGICTSVSADDATPGAFYAHVPYRKLYDQIDLDAARSGFEFIAGAGMHSLVDADGNPTEALQLMHRNGMEVYYGPEAIPTINARSAVLLNPQGTPDWNIGYVIDGHEGRLTLPQITETCLKHLQSVSPDRFFMMVEGGSIDHALHANDGGTAIREIINFDNALKVAYQFYLEHPTETLIVVTADHDTGGMSRCHSSIGLKCPLSAFDHQHASKEEFSDQCKAMLRDRRFYTWDDMKQILTEKFGLFDAIPVDEQAEQTLMDMFTATFELRNTADQETLYANFNSFAVEVFRLLNNAAGLRFTTTSHSGNPVPVFAVGVGAWRFAQFNNNIDLPNHIRRIVGISR